MRLLGTLLLLSLIGGCGSISVKTDYDRNYQFTGLNTWAWLKPVTTVIPNQQGAGTLTSQRIRNAVETQMKAKGFVLVGESARPDFFVVSHAAVEHRVNTEYVYTNYGYRYRGWNRAGYATPVSYEYDRGSLVIDVLSATAKELVWTGSASAIANLRGTSEERTKRINEAVTEVLKSFPPNGGA